MTYVSLQAVQAAVLVAVGAVEGYGFATSGISYPKTFRQQMQFSGWILVQLFTGAVGSSMIAQGIFAAISHHKFDNSRVWKYTTVGYKRAIVGCLLLGAGMTLAGSGPTMLPSQLALGTTSAPWILLGCLVGGGLFSAMEQRGWFHTNFTPKKEEKLTLEQLMGFGTYEAWSLGMGSAILAAGFAIQHRFSPKLEQAELSGLLTTPPIVAGIIVGVNQIPMRLIAECGQGGARAVMQLVAIVTGGKLAKRFKIQGLGCVHQLAYVWGGTMIGALVARTLLSLPAPTGYSPLASTVGGALMVFGARVAAGCACGHGVSGFSELGLQSMVGACCMFAGGIATMILGGLDL